MEARILAALILLPSAAVFIYAGIREYRRFKSEGRAKYGLVFDEETGTTHVSGIPEEEDGYDPGDFDPSDQEKRNDGTEADNDGTDAKDERS